MSAAATKLSKGVYMHSRFAYFSSVLSVAHLSYILKGGVIYRILSTGQRNDAYLFFTGSYSAVGARKYERPAATAPRVSRSFTRGDTRSGATSPFQAFHLAAIQGQCDHPFDARESSFTYAASNATLLTNNHCIPPAVPNFPFATPYWFLHLF